LNRNKIPLSRKNFRFDREKLPALPGQLHKIKHYRRIATRYEKTAVSFAAMLFLVGAMIWLR
jgi:transposase